MTTKCSMCGSQAINPGLHGRPTTSGEPAVKSDLCDVCYWRTEAATWRQLYDLQKFKYEVLLKRKRVNVKDQTAGALPDRQA